MYQENSEAQKKFLFALEWLLAITKRHAGPLQFGLAHINYENPKLLGATYGAQMAAQQLDEVLYSLRKTLRKTDLAARDGLDFWIIVPFTPDDEKISDKIKYILESTSLAGLQIVERDISYFSLPLKDLPPSADASPLEFLAYLKKNHSSLAHREVILPASASPT